MYYVYILQSLRDKKYYIGSTDNIQRRLIEHNRGKTISLKYRLPLKLVYYEKYNNHLEAAKREKQIKSYKSGNAFRKLIKGL